MPTFLHQAGELLAIAKEDAGTQRQSSTNTGHACPTPSRLQTNIDLAPSMDPLLTHHLARSLSLQTQL